jgi:hypothetical protein
MVLGVGLALPPETGIAQNTLYDDFESSELSAQKWRAEQTGTGGLELVRQIVAGQLLMAHRVAGLTTASIGQRRSSNRLRFPNGQHVTAVQFTVRVDDVAVLGCAAPEASISRGFAGFVGVLFNDGSSPEPTNATGDVAAFIFVERRSTSTDPEGVVSVLAGLYRCTSASCQAVPIDERVIATVPIQTDVTLRMVWEEALQQVHFQVNTNPIETFSYPQSVVTRRFFRVLQVRGDAANCADGTQPFARMTTSFDNILVNP